jgi:hypothetical protein
MRQSPLTLRRHGRRHRSARAGRNPPGGNDGRLARGEGGAGRDRRAPARGASRLAGDPPAAIRTGGQVDGAVFQTYLLARPRQGHSLRALPRPTRNRGRERVQRTLLGRTHDIHDPSSDPPRAVGSLPPGELPGQHTDVDLVFSLSESRRRRLLAMLGSDTIASLPLGQAHRTPAGITDTRCLTNSDANQEDIPGRADPHPGRRGIPSDLQPDPTARGTRTAPTPRRLPNRPSPTTINLPEPETVPCS